MVDTALIDYTVEQTTMLCAMPSPTGYTAEAVAHVERELAAMGWHPRRTVKGALLCPLLQPFAGFVDPRRHPAFIARLRKIHTA